MVEPHTLIPQPGPEPCQRRERDRNSPLSFYISTSFIHCFFKQWPTTHSKALWGHSSTQGPCVETPTWVWKENTSGEFCIASRGGDWTGEEGKLGRLTSWKTHIWCPIRQRWSTTSQSEWAHAVFDLLLLTTEIIYTFKCKQQKSTYI